MTRYTVVWHGKARDQLAQLWIDSENRSAITQAADNIDRYLALDANLKGLPIEGNLRYLTIPPLHALFVVSESDRLVKILIVTFQE